MRNRRRREPDRALVRAFVRNARAFHEMGQAAKGREGSSSAYYVAIAIELGLKAYLLHRGFSDDWTRVWLRHPCPANVLNNCDTCGPLRLRRSCASLPERLRSTACMGQVQLIERRAAPCSMWWTNLSAGWSLAVVVPQGMTKPTIARGLQPQLHHVEASELSVRPTLTHLRRSQGPLS